MITPASTEHTLNQVQLVRGKGERENARLCLMSLVALLAGERHTDAPVTASPFIRHFAITLNDTMPDEERQRLKCFAPRVLGTNDGLDTERVRLVQSAFTEEIIPRLRADLADGLPRQLGYGWASHALGLPRSPYDFFSLSSSISNNFPASDDSNKVAVLAARWLADSAGWFR